MKKTLAVFLVLCFIAVLPLAAQAGNYVYEKPTTSAALPRAALSEKGLSSQHILNLLDAIDYTGTEVHGLMIAIGGDVVYEGYYAPYTADDPHIMFSGTKIFTNAAVGVAVTEGYLHLDDYVTTVLKDYLPEKMDEDWNKVQLKHLLTMTSGVSTMLSGSKLRPLTTSWATRCLQEPIEYEPGTHYQYSSGNTMLSSAMVTVATGKTCEELLMESGFGELGFANFSWDITPDGFNAGHGGVKVTVQDMLKVGMLYMNGGLWNGKQILTKDWCDAAIGYTKTVDNQGDYAYHWVSNENGLFYTASGSYDQTLFIVPELDMAIALTAGSNNDVVSLVADNVIKPYKADLEEHKSVAAELAQRTDRLSLMGTTIVTASPLGETYDDKVLNAEDNEYGITSLVLDINNDYIDYTMSDARGTHTIRNGIGVWLKGETTMTSNYTHHQYQYPSEPIYAYAEWTDDTTLELEWRWPELAFVDKVVIKFAEDGSQATMVRSVNVNSGPLVCSPVVFK